MYFPTSPWNHEATSCPSRTPPHLWEVLYSSPEGFYPWASLQIQLVKSVRYCSMLAVLSSSFPTTVGCELIGHQNRWLLFFHSLCVSLIAVGRWWLMSGMAFLLHNILVQRVDTWSGNRLHPIWISSPGSQTLFATSPMSGTCDRSRCSISHTNQHVAHMRQRNVMNESWQTRSSNQRPLPQKRNGSCVGYGGGFMLRPCKDIYFMYTIEIWWVLHNFGLQTHDAQRHTGPLCICQTKPEVKENIGFSTLHSARRWPRSKRRNRCLKMACWSQRCRKRSGMGKA